MTINQAFEILKDSGGIRAARIIIDNNKKLSWWRVFLMSRALRRGVPVAKIIHQKWFYGLCFYTNKHTLDPRPDTETLVESVLHDKPMNPKILDLGTGTGCIIISLVKNIKNATGVAVDISSGAIRVAKRNMKKLGVAQSVRVIKANFAKPNCIHEKFDVIVSNPPYIAYGDKRVNSAATHDPKIALYAKNNGLIAYENIARNAKKWIVSKGRIYLEIGAKQEKQVIKIFEKNGWQYVRGDKDLGGILRVLVFTVDA